MKRSVILSAATFYDEGIGFSIGTQAWERQLNAGLLYWDNVILSMFQDAGNKTSYIQPHIEAGIDFLNSTKLNS